MLQNIPYKISETEVALSAEDKKHDTLEGFTEVALCGEVAVLGTHDYLSNTAFCCERVEVASQSEHTIRITLSISLQFLKDDSTRYLQTASNMIADSLSTRDVLIIMLLLLIAWHLRQSSNLPSNTPWVGGYKNPFSKALAPYMSLMHGRTWLEEV